MSPLIGRLLLAILLFPCAFLVYLVTYLYLDSYRGFHWNPDQCILLGGSATWIFVGAYWTLLWRKTVQWTPRRRVQTIGAVFGAIVAGLIASTIMLPLDERPAEFVGVCTAIVAWLIATVRIWRETAAERNLRLGASRDTVVVCPQCAYNMAGLHEARCPECGAQFTLDQLFAGQPGRTQVELER